MVLEWHEFKRDGDIITLDVLEDGNAGEVRSMVFPVSCICDIISNIYRIRDNARILSAIAKENNFVFSSSLTVENVADTSIDISATVMYGDKGYICISVGQFDRDKDYLPLILLNSDEDINQFIKELIEMKVNTDA